MDEIHPESIWYYPDTVNFGEGASFHSRKLPGDDECVEYIRADLATDALVEAEKRLARQLEAVASLAFDEIKEAEKRGAERMQTRSIKLLEALAKTVRSLSDRPDVDADRAEYLALSLLDAAETIRALPLTEEAPTE